MPRSRRPVFDRRLAIALPALVALAACGPSDGEDLQAPSTPNAAGFASALGPGCAPEPAGAVAWFTGDIDATDLVTLTPAVLSDSVSVGSAFVDGGFRFSGGSGPGLVTTPLTDFPTTDFTVEMWVQASPTNGSNATLLYYGTTSQALRIYDPSNLRVVVGAATSPASSVAIDDDAFHHLAVTWRGQDGELRVFVDGDPVYTTTLNDGFVLPEGGILRLGQRASTSTTGALSGTLDEVTVYDRVLDPDEIRAVHDAGADGKCRRDADADGTPDDRDVCPASAEDDTSAFEVDTGCYAAQLDRGLDGVCDELLAFETTLCEPPCASVPEGLIGWWPSDPGAPERELVDEANLTLSPSVTPVEGRVGEAFAFTGTAEEDASVGFYYRFPD
ncbi:MAG: LamG domain-containing protein, partial [Myxococcota bacterium]